MKTKREKALLRKKYMDQLSRVICESHLYSLEKGKKQNKKTYQQKKYKKNKTPTFQQLELFVSVDQYVDVNIHGKEAIDDLNCEEAIVSETEINKGKIPEQSVSLVSPIMNEDSIVNLRRFETIVSWIPSKIKFNNLIEDEYFTVDELKVWLSKDDLYSLLYKDQINDKNCTDFFTEQEAERFVGEFFNTDQGQEYLNYKWRKTIRLINSELRSRIGIIRLGKNRLPGTPRVWIGRNSCAKSSRILIKAFDTDTELVSEKIVNAFIGKDAFDKAWDFCYRGGTWKIIVYDKSTVNRELPKVNNVFYVEEFEGEDLL
jgi:hypothetical protein